MSVGFFVGEASGELGVGDVGGDDVEDVAAQAA